MNQEVAGIQFTKNSGPRFLQPVLRTGLRARGGAGPGPEQVLAEVASQNVPLPRARARGRIDEALFARLDTVRNTFRHF